MNYKDMWIVRYFYIPTGTWSAARLYGSFDASVDAFIKRMQDNYVFAVRLYEPGQGVYDLEDYLWHDERPSIATVGEQMCTDQKLEITVPKWDVPRQNRIAENQREMGWCLTNVNDPPLGGRVLTFRRMAT